MNAIEIYNPELKDVLPKGYQRLEKSTLIELLRLFAPLPRTLSGDAFGLIYEDFLSNFAMAEGRLGGEFFTPHAIVRLIVEIIEPYSGRVFDPACGSGGMFVQCAKFVERHKGSATERLSVFGQEQKEVTVPLAKMNLALHGVSGDIRLGNSYYDDLHSSAGAFDFVMANPPFNVNGVDMDKLEGDTRFRFGVPRSDNANYLWIQLFFSALSERGRAGFVMHNSAADAPAEAEIRRKLILSKSVDVLVAVGPNFFYTVTLPVTLWFLDKAKSETNRGDTVLFIDARQIFHQVDRVHRDFLPEHIELVSGIVRAYRGEQVVVSDALFPGGIYRDVPGLCKVATIQDIAEKAWSLIPARYTGTSVGVENIADVFDELTERYESWAQLKESSDELDTRVHRMMLGLLAQ